MSSGELYPLFLIWLSKRLHVILPMQAFPSALGVKPRSQVHLKLPGSFTQRPFLQMLSCRHSSISEILQHWEDYFNSSFWPHATHFIINDIELHKLMASQCLYVLAEFPSFFPPGGTKVLLQRRNDRINRYRITYPNKNFNRNISKLKWCKWLPMQTLGSAVFWNPLWHVQRYDPRLFSHFPSTQNRGVRHSSLSVE